MADDIGTDELKALAARAISQPLVTHIYTADPSAHVFDGKLYIYPSHDIDAGLPFDDDGDHFGMEDYHVLRMDSPDRRGRRLRRGPARQGRAVGAAADVGARRRQQGRPVLPVLPGQARRRHLPDRRGGRRSARRVRSCRNRSRSRAATRSTRRCSPTTMASTTCTSAVIWGGQLQKYRDNAYGASHSEPADGEPALGPRVARLTADMKQFAEAPREVLILDEAGQPLLRRRPRSPLLRSVVDAQAPGQVLLLVLDRQHALPVLRGGRQSVRSVHYQGTILTPVVGWTTHHSICEFQGHTGTCSITTRILSGGVTHLRSIKVTELHYDRRGRIVTIDPYGA